MKTTTFTFKSVDAIGAFVRAIEWVNDSAITIVDIYDRPYRLVVQDSDHNEDEEVEVEI